MNSILRRTLLLAPAVFVGFFLILPLGFTFVISFWMRVGFKVQPAFTLKSYAEFFSGVRLLVLERSLLASVEATALSLLIAYPIAYFIARRIKPELTRSVLMLFTIPFLVNYIIRTFAWTYMLGRTGPINSILLQLGLVDQVVDWFLYSDFAVLLGLVTSYMPFMIFPLWLSLSRIDSQLVEASWLLGANPIRSFFRITLPLSLPGIFAAVIFGFVGCFGESAVPIILGGVGYQLMGNTITSAMDVLNYPLAAAMSSVVVGAMMFLLTLWYFAFDMRSFLGKIMSWRV
ncbi:MAG: ABC transporter permease [Deltaproteobacteria bacterium]|nr:ABC transporter permease [Deltaproteobacteria bacterium]